MHLPQNNLSINKIMHTFLSIALTYVASLKIARMPFQASREDTI